MLSSYQQVDGALRSEVDWLIEACSPADGFTMELYTDASLNVYKDMECAFAIRESGQLAGFLFVFAPGPLEVEINALVHPQFRRKGLFKAMLAAALAACGEFSYQRGFVFCSEDSAAAVEMLEKWQLRLSHIEYQMEKALVPPAPSATQSLLLAKITPEDVPEAAPLMAECFDKDPVQQETYLRNSIGTPDRTNWVLRDDDGRILGFCGSYCEGTALNLFGLGVMPEFRRQGYGRILLDLISGIALGQGLDTLKLDVDSGNPNAIRLYTAYGFRKIAATRYYEIAF